MDTAQVLRDERRRAGLTQAQLAERSGTSQTAVSAYESGAKTPSIETFARLLAELGSRLVVEPGAPTPGHRSARDHSCNARVLLDVLELASRLPARHNQRLGFPRLA